jgi:hypothetical protein
MKVLKGPEDDKNGLGQENRSDETIGLTKKVSLSS